MQAGSRAHAPADTMKSDFSESCQEGWSLCCQWSSIAGKWGTGLGENEGRFYVNVISIQAYEDKNFKGTEITFAPGQRVPNLGKLDMANDIESRKISCQK